MDDPVEQALTPKILARQQPRGGDPERQRHDRCHDRNAQRQEDSGPFLGRQVQQVYIQVSNPAVILPLSRAMTPGESSRFQEATDPEAPFRLAQCAYGALRDADDTLAS